jgi:hypothetical protein
VTTAINSPELSKMITITPNPTSDDIVIRYSGNSTRFVAVLCDMSGKKIFSKGEFTTTYQLSLRGYSAGLYIVQIINIRNGEQTRKLVMKQ